MMSIFRLNVAARFVLVLLIGLLFQAVISIISLLDLKQSMLHDRTSEVKHLLEVGYSTMVYYHQQALAGTMTDQQAKQTAGDVLRNLHYDNGNYYFVWDLDGTMVVHGGQASYENKNFLSGPEASKYPVVSRMVRRIVEVSRSPAGEGLTTYQIPKGGQTIPLDKISYCRLFAPWGWSIGTGAYIDDIDEVFERRAMKLLVAFIGLMIVAGAATYYVVRDLVMAMKRLSLRINSLTSGELLGPIPDVERNDELGTMARALLMLRDTSKEVSELKLDHLTGLPTRKLLMDRIKQSMVRSERNGMFSAVMLLDLDKFKLLNDTHGHDAGDKLLKEVATRLSRSLRESDTVARLGGDEFVVLLVDLGHDVQTAKTSASRIGEKILEALNQDYHLGHIVHHCAASAGMTIYKGKTVSADDLLKQADIAMYKSKDSRSATCHFFEVDSRPLIDAQPNFEEELNAALTQNQFVLHYQPQIGVDGKLLGCEALIRWQHPQRGLLHPDAFLPLVEKQGLLSLLGNIALEMACAQIAAWTQAAERPELVDIRVSVNIGASHFRHAEFVDQLLAIIQRTRVRPSHLMLELSEQALANHIDIVIEKMAAIRKLGLEFSIDDFGMSYVPLSQLSHLPIQEIKICTTMLQTIFADTASLATPKMILAMARSLSWHTVAVGVETEAQQTCMIEAGCAAFQGNLYCEPLSAAEFEQWVKHREPG